MKKIITLILLVGIIPSCNKKKEIITYKINFSSYGNGQNYTIKLVSSKNYKYEETGTNDKAISFDGKTDEKYKFIITSNSNPQHKLLRAGFAFTNGNHLYNQYNEDYSKIVFEGIYP